MLVESRADLHLAKAINELNMLTVHLLSLNVNTLACANEMIDFMSIGSNKKREKLDEIMTEIIEDIETIKVMHKEIFAILDKIVGEDPHK